MIMFPTTIYNFSINSSSNSCFTFHRGMCSNTSPKSFLGQITPFFAVFVPSVIHDLGFASFADNLS